MSEAQQSWQREEAELKVLLSSDLFARAPSLGLLLEYICRRRFAGEDHLIKEYNIAVEALGRPADFDQKKDSIVRVEAHRLRKRLKQYYQTEGASHEIEIEILPRGYAPVFKLRQDSSQSSVADPITEEGLAMGDDDSGTFNFAADLESAGQPPPDDADRLRAKSRRIRATIVFGLVVLAGAGAGGWAVWKRQSGPGAGPEGEALPSATSGPAPTDSVSEIRISCGSSRDTSDREGHVWLADRYFRGGEAKVVRDGDFEGTLNPELFRSWRQGSFTYRIPLKQGVYELALSMAEPAPAPGQTRFTESSRLFDVLVNGVVVLNEFDLVSDAGAASVADWRVFRDIQPDRTGHLVIEMRDRVGGAILNGISVTPASPGRLRPIRVGMRERPYTDVAGRLWSEDRYFSGGRQVKRTENIAGTEDPEIYRNERFGRLKYTIPVPPDASYTLILHFAETWFGGTGKGGDGSRAFDVLCNGQMLISSFDVHREAGGPFRAYTRTFRGIRPRENGKVILELIPSKNYAFLNALELLDESHGASQEQAAAKR